MLDRCLVGCFLGFLTWFPRVSINAIIIWGVSTHLAVCYSNGGICGELLGMVGVFTGICAWVSYNKVWAVPAGSTCEFLQLLGDEEMGVPDCISGSVEAKDNGSYRYCNKCARWKPDRAHHCRRCGRCILRMDHHCPWFTCCLGLRNQKYFVQCLFYTILLCVAASISGTVWLRLYFLSGPEDPPVVNYLIYLLVAIVMGLSIGVFFAYTLWLLACNRTTLEHMESKAIRTSLAASRFRYRAPPTTKTLGNIWDVGSRENICQIMGYTWKEWILPIRASTSGLDGLQYPHNADIIARAEERAQSELAMHRRKQDVLDRMRTSAGTVPAAV